MRFFSAHFLFATGRNNHPAPPRPVSGTTAGTRTGSRDVNTMRCRMVAAALLSILKNLQREPATAKLHLSRLAFQRVRSVIGSPQSLMCASTRRLQKRESVMTLPFFADFWQENHNLIFL